jgi:hypothetical protein
LFVFADAVSFAALFVLADALTFAFALAPGIGGSPVL